ncbi:hypothetical protein KPH14_004841 [Odynerus spinipes]|uniref:MOSC domain-containing protein n=1 Tax=Odynerus spinipes TaxID=1348599 RepID=A0AAD9RN36_9HYME|nr:hypothetical protein KPH14_004841 [Odynerus spinipes]
MHGADWRSTVAISCGVAVILVIVIWNARSKKKSSPEKSESKNTTGNVPTDSETDNCCEKKVEVRKEEIKRERRETSDFPELKWVKVARVEELYYYPLKSGRGKAVGECKFTEHGISIESNGLFSLNDRMFLVYNEETRRFKTGREYPTMILVSLSAVDERKVKLEAVGMPSVVFRVPEKTEKSSAIVECTMWWGEPVKCIDCGPEPAEWLSRFLTGTNSGLRLGFSLFDKRQLTKGPWERFTKVYNNLKDEDTGLFADLTSYMLMSSQSLDMLNEKLETPVPALQFRPNIVVSGEGPFVEDTWEWIKIGDRAIIRNVKPCSRCRMIKVNPATGIADKAEPFKTLKSFREQKDPEKRSLEGSAPTLGIYCGLYVTGRVKVGDDVFVHVPDNIENLKMSNEEESTKSC